jgi:hypothetical protein
VLSIPRPGRRTAGRRSGAVLFALVSATFASVARGEGPPTTAEELAAMRLADPGLTINLVAAEPELVSPVAFAWDERGALFVAEMRDYPVAPPGAA